MVSAIAAIASTESTAIRALVVKIVVIMEIVMKTVNVSVTRGTQVPTARSVPAIAKATEHVMTGGVSVLMVLMGTIVQNVHVAKIVPIMVFVRTESVYAVRRGVELIARLKAVSTTVRGKVHV